MTKSIEDYRNIVKILKLQLLKVREQNSQISNQMGIISDSETSSFTPKLNRYKQSGEVFSQKICLFLQFAHRCEVVGITPQMVFRITDKKRDKDINASNLIEIMKRIKIRMPQESVNKFVAILSRKDGKNIQYDQYLQFLSAFQINSQKYPVESSRTYVQLSLISFARQCKTRYPKTGDLFQRISNSSKNYFKYNDLVDFCLKQCKQLKQNQIVSIFLGLDLQSLCMIQRQIFQRQIDKIYNLIQKGIPDQKIQTKSSPKKRIPQKKAKDSQSEDDFKYTQQTGVQKGFTKAKQKSTNTNTNAKQEAPKSKVKLEADTNMNRIQGQLAKHGISCSDLITRLIEIEIKKQKYKINNKDRSVAYLKAFSLGDIIQALKLINQKFPKKDIIKVFKYLDKNQNGSTSTEQLIKLLIRTDYDTLFSNPQYLFALLYRHLKQIQFPDALLRFTSLGFKTSQKVTKEHLTTAFEKLQISSDELTFIYPILVKNSDLTVEKFCQLLKKEPSTKQKVKFQKMDKNNYKTLASILAQIKKRKQKQSLPPNFKKLIRSQDGSKNDQNCQVWNTIFNDQWDCFNFCLQTANKLQYFWRDQQFGPTKSDKHGLRSIFGNQNEKPPGIPEQQNDIEWLSYNEIIQRKKERVDSKFMNKQLKSTDVVQGNLGDCWYISALSIITTNSAYIKGKKASECRSLSHLTYGICPPLFQFFSKFGLYVFKFFKQFRPVYVVVDQLFPVESSTNDLIFAKSPDLSLQWVSFAQKAYAKLHHTYTNMISGDIAQGLNDLTNSLPIKQNLVLENQENIDKIRQFSKKQYLMGCSIKIQKGDTKGMKQPPVEFDDQKCGLVAGHAYSIIDYITLRLPKANYQLMRVRNPWGNTEWILDWSDKPQNNEQSKLELYAKQIDQFYNKKLKSDRGQARIPAYKPGQDGQFLMDVNDWNKIFTNLFVGINTATSDLINNALLIKDSWNSKKQSGLCKTKNASANDKKMFASNNHQYILQIDSQSQLLMLLIQRDGRLYRGQKYPYKETVNAAIILVFKLQKNEELLKQFDKDKLIQPKSLSLEVRRDVDLWCKLKPGRYSIMPCRKQKSEQETEFQFRIYSSNQNMKLKKVGHSKNFQAIKNKEEPYEQDKLNSLIKFLAANNPKYQE